MISPSSALNYATSAFQPPTGFAPLPELPQPSALLNPGAPAADSFSRTMTFNAPGAQTISAAPLSPALPQTPAMPAAQNFQPLPAPVAPMAAGPQEDGYIINQALNLLGQIQFNPADVQAIRAMGINPPFASGAEALQVLRAKNARVEFGDMGDSPAHAQWIAEQNLVMINQKYRGDASPATLYAISEAICHEAGHTAGNGDNQSSIQEELNCLALNTLAHRYHKAIDPAYAATTSSSPLIANGVALYDKLFFDPDPNKQALVNRVVEKYGDLPIWSPGHDVPAATAGFMPMAYKVAAQVDANNVASGKMPPSPALAQSQGLQLPVLPMPQAVAPRLNWIA